MKIKDKITLSFTLITSTLFLVSFILIYFFSAQYIEKEFFQRLEERANIVALSHLEKDELSTEIYNEILKKYFQTLPKETETLFKILSDSSVVLREGDPNRKYPQEFLDEILKNNHAELRTGERHHIGIYYKDNEGNFIVISSAKNIYGTTKLNNLANILSVLFFTALLLIYFTGRIYASKVLAPISKITHSANNISISNLHLRLITNNNNDEIAELSETFNHMLDRLESSVEMQASFINNASHELRNPLTIITGEAEVVLQNNRSTDEYKHSIEVIRNEAYRLELLIKQLLELSDADSDNSNKYYEEIRVDELVLDVKESISTMFPKSSIIIDFSYLPDDSEQMLFHGNYSMLKVALSNILDNACKFSDGKPVTVTIKLSPSTLDIIIEDKGIGIPKESINKISEPFYRAKNAIGVNGSGIGLTLTHKILRIHGATLKIISDESSGTKAIISLPIKNRL